MHSLKQRSDGHNMRLISTFVGVATLGGFMFGYDSGVINGTQAGLKAAFDVSDTAIGFLVGILSIGCATGAFLAGRLADVYGRRGVMLAAALLFIITALLAGSANSALIFSLARFAAGAAVGAVSVLAPAYIAEVTPARIRGGLSSVQQIMIIIGITGAFIVNFLFATWAGSSLSTFHGATAWRWMFWVQTIPALLFLLALLTIPESPRFLVSKRREAEAQSVLARLFGASAARAKVAEIRASLAADHRPSFGDLTDNSTGRIHKVVYVGVVLAALQQFVGINVIFYYGAVLWQAVGSVENDAFLRNIISGGVSIIACLVTIGVVDKVGRKPLLLIGSCGMAVTLGLVTWCFAQGTLTAGTLHLPPFIGMTALVAANLYVIFFNGTWGPVLWVMLGEMFPNQMRGSALAVAGATLWLSNFVMNIAFPPAMAMFGLAVTYGFFTLCAVLSFFFVLRMVQETTGKELEEMGVADAISIHMKPGSTGGAGRELSP